MTIPSNDPPKTPPPGASIGSYLAWARLTDFAFLPKTEDGRRAVLLRLKVTARAFATLMAGGRSDASEIVVSERIRALVRVPAVYRSLPAGLDTLPFCAVEVERAFFDALETDPALVALVDGVEIGPPGMPNIDVETLLPTSSGLPTGRPVVAVIDDGIAFAHARFRRADGSPRIDYFWDMDNPGGANPGFFGSQLDAAQIAALMAAATHAGVVDEDEVYRRAGVSDFALAGHKSLALRLAHGTHVLDAVCGAAPATRAPGDAAAPYVIAVQLPSRVIRDTSGATLAPYLMLGVLYVLVRADQLAAAAGRTAGAVTINMSVGMSGGPHDGSSTFEQLIDAIVAAWNGARGGGLGVVMPSGNNLQARGHARFALAAGATRELVWRILPDDATPSFVELWLPQAPAGVRLAVTLVAPDGARSPALAPGDAFAAIGGRAVASGVYAPGATGRDHVLLTVAPTTTHDPRAVIAPSGRWRIEVRRVDAGTDDAPIDAWIRRDDTPYGFRILGRQSRFEDPDYVRFDARGALAETDSAGSWVKREGTVNGFATGSATLVVSGYREADGTMAPYAAAGPVSRPATRLAPDVAAPSDDSRVCHGLIAAGARSGSRVAMWGTSVAAPRVARWIAGLPTAATRQPAAALQDAAVADEWVVQLESPSPAPVRMGAGRIRLDSATSSVDRKG